MKGVYLRIEGNNQGGFLNDHLKVQSVILKDFVVSFNHNCKLITAYSNKLQFKVIEIAKSIKANRENRI